MKKLCATSILLCLSILSFAQNPENRSFYHTAHVAGTTNNLSPETAGFSGTGANIDVIYQRINWTADPNDVAKYITGTVTTYFKTLVANVSTINFDFRKSSFDTSTTVVRHHGTVVAHTFPASGNVNIINIPLTATIATAGTTDSITINYSGRPPVAAGAAQGYQVGTNATAGKYINTLSESYEDRDWWPCKHDMQDKIDSMDINVTVPWTGVDTFWVATNGVLYDSTITASTRTFKYKTRYPIASYLVCLTVARFNRYYRTPVNINGTNVPVVYYLFAGKTAGTYTTILTAMDNMRMALDSLSDRYGDYGFKNEKHGYYEGLQGAAGMEHQTFSAIATASISSNTVLAHELAHQWFGDKVSFATWNDLWLAEGFARYSESLVGELVPATGIVPLTKRSNSKIAAQGIPTTSVRLSNASIVNSDAIWTGANDSAVYDKGAMVVGMLRALLGDTKFFTALKNYQTSLGLAYKSATTDSLKFYMNQQAGMDMTNFFDDWVLGTGHPTTVINWNVPVAKKLSLSVASQTKTGSSTVAYFDNVIALNVKNTSLGKDTTIIIYDQGSGNLSKAGNGISAATPGNLLNYDLSFTPNYIAFDSLKQTLSNGSLVHLGTLDLQIVDFNVQQSKFSNTAYITLDDNTINSDIILERSTNGISFKDLGKMALQSSQINKKYFFEDIFPAATNYYRVRFNNQAGTAIFSKIIKISATNNRGFTIINNISSGSIILKLADATLLNREVSFTIYDELGRKTLETKRHLNSVLNEINVAALPKGAYTVRISTKEEMSSGLKFIVD